MTVGLYMDVHVPQPITDQLRRRGVDVLTAIEDGADRLPDDQLLERAESLRRILFTQDIRFRAMAEQWQRDGKTFAGLIFAHPLRASIGRCVGDLEIVAFASEPDEWQNIVEHLPLS